MPVAQLELVHEVAVTAQPGMRVPARVYADDELWEQIGHDRSLAQLKNVATLPGVTGAVYGMPDMHEGYGFPVGGVAAMRLSDGVISPGGVGYDINCGVRLLVSDLTAGAHAGEARRPGARALAQRAVGRRARRSARAERGRAGSRAGRGMPAIWSSADSRLAEDLEVIEARGCLAGADPSAVSARAKHRGHDQLGTIGSGNHFVEVQVVDEVCDVRGRHALGLASGQVTVLIHTGSRGLGHQVCTDYVRLMDEVMPGTGSRCRIASSRARRSNRPKDSATSARCAPRRTSRGPTGR